MLADRIVIGISGTPGTGKTTTTKGLKQVLSAETINLTETAIENDFILETDVERQTKVANLEKLTQFLEIYIRSHSNNIIIEGHYADIIPAHLVSIFFVLRTDPFVLKERLIEKGFFPTKIQENLQSEILGTCTSAALEKYDKNILYEIDNSTIPLKNILIEIETIINERPPSNVGKINWMSQLEDSELLNFFK